MPTVDVPYPCFDIWGSSPPWRPPAMPLMYPCDRLGKKLGIRTLQVASSLVYATVTVNTLDILQLYCLLLSISAKLADFYVTGTFSVNFNMLMVLYTLNCQNDVQYTQFSVNFRLFYLHITTDKEDIFSPWCYLSGGSIIQKIFKRFLRNIVQLWITIMWRTLWKWPTGRHFGFMLY